MSEDNAKDCNPFGYVNVLYSLIHNKMYLCRLDL